MKRGKLALIGFLISFFALVVSAGTAWLMYEHTKNILIENLKGNLLAIVKTGGALLSPDDISQLQNEEDWKRPEWGKVVGQLLSIERNNDNILFVYLFRKSTEDPSRMVFVSDSHSINPFANTDDSPNNDVDANRDGVIEPDGADYLQWPGQDYETPPDETFVAYYGPTTSALYEDAFGSVITGYQPIYSHDGQVEAVLAVDIRANDYAVITTQTLYPFLAFIVFLIGVILILTASLIRIWERQIELIVDLDKQKDELLSIVSHQLATPVSSVKWYVEMLLAGDLGKITAEQKEHLSTMQSVSTNLSDLVSMILDVSRIQLGRMKLDQQELDLNEFFKEILDIITPKAKEKKINLKVEMPSQLPKAKLDKRYTHMTIENLLSNAVKYTPESGTVELTVKIDNGKMYCNVRDTGCGIPKADQDKIFGKLFRASNVRNSVDGNGFGLYVAKGAVEAQGGKISFKSTEGKGTTFFVQLPLSLSSQPSENTA